MLISTADLPLIDELSCCSASPLSHRYHSHSHYSLSGINDSNVFNNNKLQKAAVQVVAHPQPILPTSPIGPKSSGNVMNDVETKIESLQICDQKREPHGVLITSTLNGSNSSRGRDTLVEHREVNLDDVDLSSALPELLSDFKTQLCGLQDAIKRDHEEIETLRLQNEYLRKQMAERDQIIEQLQLQLRTASLLMTPKMQPIR